MTEDSLKTTAWVEFLLGDLENPSCRQATVASLSPKLEQIGNHAP